MASLNKVFLIGNLTRDPTLRKLPSGDPVAGFRLAVNRRFRDRNGQDREETLFIDVSVFGPRAEVVSRYLRAGSPLFVEGRLRLEEWTDKAGGRQSRISVVAENFEFLGGRGAEERRRFEDAAPEGEGDAVEPTSAEPPADEPPTGRANREAGRRDAEDLPF